MPADASTPTLNTVTKCISTFKDADFRDVFFFIKDSQYLYMKAGNSSVMILAKPNGENDFGRYVYMDPENKNEIIIVKSVQIIATY